MCQHQDCQKEALKLAEQVCAALKVRFTEHRRRVFEIIWQNHKALTAADIMQEMENKQPPITYRALEFLKDVGLVHYIVSLNAYVGCLHPKEGGHVGQMLICTKCRTVTELMPNSVLEGLDNEAHRVGFHPAQVHVEMLGLCDGCYGKA
ncbi:MAG: transcriptional repressor [Alphaproteobacteria bacterium]|nr:transcriptional repressor [Alphaproteobacteria bacterium]